jgi:Tfp pilus assembly protein PilO
MSLRLNYQGKITLSVLIFLVLFSCLTGFFVVPVWESVKTIKNRIDEQRLQAEKNYDQGRSLKKLTDNIKVVEPHLLEIEQVFIEKKDEVSFITSLEMAAARNNVTENANSGTKMPLGKFYAQIPLQLTVRGDIQGVMGFVADLESMKNHININSLQITANDSGLAPKTGTSTPQKNVTAIISSVTYWKN